MTLVKVIDPVHPSADDTSGAKPTDRFVGVELRFGTETHASETPPYLNSQLVDTAGASYDPQLITVPTEAGQPLPGEVKLAKGDVRSGALVFKLPRSVKPAQFTIEAGAFGGDTGEWHIP